MNFVSIVQGKAKINNKPTNNLWEITELVRDSHFTELKVYCIVASVNDIWFDFFGGKFSLLEVEYEVEETSKVIKCNKLTVQDPSHIKNQMKIVICGLI
jgi:hypothetical protein